MEDFWSFFDLFKHSGLEPATPPTPANKRAVHYLHHEVIKCLKAIGDPVLEMPVNKLVNAAIEG